MKVPEVFSSLLIDTLYQTPLQKDAANLQSQEQPAPFP